LPEGEIGHKGKFPGIGGNGAFSGFLDGKCGKPEKKSHQEQTGKSRSLPVVKYEEKKDCVFKDWS